MFSKGAVEGFQDELRWHKMKAKMNEALSLQEQLAPRNACFGCGPVNEKGLRLRSFPAPDGTGLVAEWQPQKHHEAFDNILCGGIIGTLLDCHSNWTAAYYLMKEKKEETLPPTVTSEFAVKLKRPAPTNGPVRLVSKVIKAAENRVTVESYLEAQGKICATCVGEFISVPPGHPAYRRW